MDSDLAAAVAHGSVERLAPLSLDQLTDIDADECGSSELRWEEQSAGDQEHA